MVLTKNKLWNIIPNHVIKILLRRPTLSNKIKLYLIQIAYMYSIKNSNI